MAGALWERIARHKIAVISALTVTSIALAGVAFTARLDDILYQQLFFIIIVLGAIWIGRKVAWIAALFSATHFFTGYLISGTVSPIGALGSVSYIFIALILSELFASKRSVYIELTEDNDRLSSIIQLHPDAALIIDTEGKIIAWNKAMENLTGLRASSMVGLKDREYSVPFYGSKRPMLIDLALNNDPVAQRLYPDVREKNGKVEAFFTEVKINGRPIVIHVTASRIYDCHGNVVGAIESMRDMTEQVRVKTALEESETKFRTIFEYSPVGIALGGMDGRMIDCNPKFCEIVGYSADELRNMYFVDYTHPDDVRQDIKFIKDVREGLRKEFQIIKRYIRKDGTIVWVNLTASYIRDSGGIPRYSMGIAEDITEKRKIIETLKESESMFRTLMDTAACAILIIQDDRIEYVNPATEAMIGYSEEQMRGRMVTDIRLMINEKMRNGHAGHDIGSGGQSVDTNRYELKIICGDGQEKWIDATTGVMDYRGRPALLVTAFDITERKIAEDRIKASLAEKEVLLKEVHHRVKNNLQIISSLLSIQSDNIKDHHALEVLRDSQNRIRSIAFVHEKLYQSGDLSKINFVEYIEVITMHLFKTYGANPVRVRIRLDIDNVPLSMDTAVPCGLIINELVTNALKYAFPGERNGEIHITLKPGQDTMTLKVSDNGVGLPESLDYKNTPSVGLQLVNMLTEQIGGDIELDRHCGTCFTITFHDNNR